MGATDQEITTLATSHDIIALGLLADEARRRLHGSRTTFLRVATVSANEAAPVDFAPAAGEVRILGKPKTRAGAVARVAAVAQKTKDLPLSAFSLADLEELAIAERVTLRSILEELSAAGAELVAEAPIDRLQMPRRAIEEANIAGLAVARLTVDRFNGADPLPVLKSVSELQRAVGVIRAFAPLARVSNPAVPTTGYEDVKRIALARLIVENVPSIQVDWALYGPKLAQIALTVGADDVDGVLATDDVTAGPRRAPLAEIQRNIRAAGQEPVERDGRFDLLTR